MATLPQIQLDFNLKLKLSNDGEALSSDTGTLLFKEFDEKIGFSETLTDYLKLNDNRLYHTYSNEDLLIQKIYQMLAGYDEDDAADHLTHAPIFTQIVQSEALASQPSLSRLYSRFDDDAIDALQQANQMLLDKVHQYRDSQAIIFDLDSTP